MIELVIVVAIIGIMLGVGLPSIRTWMRNTEVRGAADSIISGMQRARAEATRTNQCVAFVLTNANFRADWQVITDSNQACNTFVAPFNNPPTVAARVLVLNENAPNNSRIRIGASLNLLPDTAVGLQNPLLAAGQNMPNAVFIFNGFGRLEPSIAANVPRYVDILDPTAVGDPRVRRLRIQINTGGEVRMCDPAFSTDPGQATFNIMGCER